MKQHDFSLEWNQRSTYSNSKKALQITDKKMCTGMFDFALDETLIVALETTVFPPPHELELLHPWKLFLLGPWHCTGNIGFLIQILCFPWDELFVKYPYTSKQFCTNHNFLSSSAPDLFCLNLEIQLSKSQFWREQIWH